MSRFPRRYVIREPRQLAAMVSPVRHQMVRLMCVLGECTVRELAERLGRSPESLYYHVRALERVGLIVLTRRRSTAGKPEALYHLAGEYLFTDPTQTDPEYLSAMQRSVSSLLRLADRQLHAALETQKEQGTPRAPNFRIQQYQARLSRRDLKRLQALLDELSTFLEEHDDPRESAISSVTFAVAPMRVRED